MTRVFPKFHKRKNPSSGGVTPRARFVYMSVPAPPNLLLQSTTSPRLGESGFHSTTSGLICKMWSRYIQKGSSGSHITFLIRLKEQTIVWAIGPAQIVDVPEP